MSVGSDLNHLSNVLCTFRIVVIHIISDKKRRSVKYDISNCRKDQS